MTETAETNLQNQQNRTAINRYLRDYRRTYAMMKSSALTRKYSGEGALDAEADEAVFRAKMFEIRAFVLSIDQTPEKMLLYYYYINFRSLAMIKAYYNSYFYFSTYAYFKSAGF